MYAIDKILNNLHYNKIMMFFHDLIYLSGSSSILNLGGSINATELFGPN